jgi:hypothetical protein
VCDDAIVTVLLESRTVPPLVISAYDLISPPKRAAERADSAAVSVLLPWSM